MTNFELDLGDISFRQQVRMYWRNAKDEWIDEEKDEEALKFIVNTLHTPKFNNSTPLSDPHEILNKLKMKGDEYTTKTGIIFKKSPYVCIGETNRGEVILIILVAAREQGMPFPRVWLRFSVPIVGTKRIESDEEKNLSSRFALMTADVIEVPVGALVEILNGNLYENQMLFNMWSGMLEKTREGACYVADEFHKKYCSEETDDKWWV